MGRSGSTGRWSTAGPALLLLLAQVVLGEGTQQKSNSHAQQLALPERPQISDSTHGIQKRSVSILARNGDLPFFRKEWNKKLHPGFRGMNVEDKDEEETPSKRYVGSLVRGGGYPTVQGKRTSGSLYDALEGYSPEEEPLETYIPEDWAREDDSSYSMGKRGGVSSLARANGFGPYQSKYGKRKRSVAALARSGELLSIGRGSNQDRDGSGSSASKRGLGSILRSGGISNIGKNSVHMGALVNGKRGIESLARNYALPSMISQDYDSRSDLPEEMDESVALPLNEPLYDEEIPVEESEGPKEVDADELIAKRHLGSFVRTYGFKPGMKRNLGSVLRNGGFGYTGKRNEEFYPYDVYSNDKRHYSSLLKNNGAYMPHKRDEDDDDYFDAEKRHLSSILHDRNAVMYGKRYLGSIARQGMLGGRHEKKDSSDWGFNEGQWTRGDSSVGKRSITEGDSGMPKGETYFDRQDDSRTTNETAEDELKNAAGSTSGGLKRQRSTGLGQDEKKKASEDSPKHRQRRSLAAPYGSSDEYPMPVLQNSDFYDLGNQEEEEWEGSPDKRFMDNSAGSLDRWGWFPRQFPHAVIPADGSGEEVTQLGASSSQRWVAPAGASLQLHKRHIGALARLGWLPAIRSQRRFSRGLGKRSEEEYFGGREDTAHGAQSAASQYSRPESIPPEAPLAVMRVEPPPEIGDSLIDEVLESPEVQWSGGWRLDPRDEETLRGALAEKRYLLLPAIDHLLLRKLYPRQMLPLLV